MRIFTPEERQNIDVNGYDVLPTYFANGTLSKELAESVVQCIHNVMIVEKKHFR